MQRQDKFFPQTFPDHQQTYWQLASIQSAAVGLPAILAGGYLSAKIGAGSAIISIIIGNLMLWIIGFSIISMAAPTRDNATENAERYLGKIGGFFSAIFLIIAFLSWYILQINFTVDAINYVIQWKINGLRLGAALGFFIALMSIGGIYLIKHFCSIIFPVLVTIIGYLTYKSDYIIETNQPLFVSLSGIVSIILIGFPGTINLPTFFRHARSRADSYLGLSLFILFTVIFQLFSVFVGYSTPTSIQVNGFFDQIVLVALILLTLICVNLVNIYFASAGWEMILPHRHSVKEYVVIGLLGTTAFTFFQISKPMEFLEEMADNFIVSLGTILLLAFLTKIIVRHRPRTNEQFVNVFCWFFGGTVATIIQALGQEEESYVFLIAISASCIIFLLFIFIEETNWALKKLFFNKK